MRSEDPLTAKSRTALAKHLLGRHSIGPKSMIFFEKHVIIRTTHKEVQTLRDSLEGMVCNGSVLHTEAVSGAIGKLKNLVRSSRVVKFGEILQ